VYITQKKFHVDRVTAGTSDFPTEKFLIFFLLVPADLHATFLILMNP